MNFKLFLIFFFIFFSGCLGSFKKHPNLKIKENDPILVVPKISLYWQKIVPFTSSKVQILSLIGYPDFIDNHKTGEDWYYNYQKGLGFGLISFPSSGHLTDIVQYIKYPDWEKVY